MSNERSNPYTSEWWYGNIGQRIARIMFEESGKHDGEKLFCNDYVVMVAKAAYEAGVKDGVVDGYNEGWDAGRRHILDRI